MSELGNVSLGNNTQQIVEAIRELTKQVQIIQQLSDEESLRLEGYKQDRTFLEFILLTGGLVKGEILWLGNKSIGIKTDSGQKIILYKHSIAFIQEPGE